MGESFARGDSPRAAAQGPSEFFAKGLDRAAATELTHFTSPKRGVGAPLRKLSGYFTMNNDFTFDLSRPQVMGILNITPDSFYESFASPEKAIARAIEIQDEGADILDIGAQSTGPGSHRITAREELYRLLPVLEALLRHIKIPISIDTFYPEVAARALSLGARIVNDVSGAVAPEMARAVKSYGAGWILMHNQGGADAAPAYLPDVVTVVAKALRDMAAQAQACGIEAARICVDPGIGFGKTQEDNALLLAHTAQLKIPGMAYLVGASRKRVTGGTLAGALAANALALRGGADILRVHDVKETVRQIAEQIAEQIAGQILPGKYCRNI